jgi:hypothetical protein
MKSITALYLDSYNAIAAKQHAKYGNPIGEAPPHVPNALHNAIASGAITEAQARKLATKLGRKAYGEYGLTSGVVSMVVEDVIPRGSVPWHVEGGLTSALSNY